jgi:WD40 repeat protein
MGVVRIFLSYGHDEYASLALRIKRDVEARGHEAWFDLGYLRVGGDWEQYIADGLDWAAAVPGTGCFLLLMTPHSVRRPNGYCLNELARALGRNLPIIPVMVSTVEPPLSICRLQWLDMLNCFPAEQHEAQYQKRFEQLLKAIEEKLVPFEGVQQRLLNYLQPITYDDPFRHLTRFTGREWVMTEVEQWLASSARVLWVTGEAGVGKSALAAWLCNRRPEIAAYHYCRFGNSERVDPRRILFSLAYQLSTQLPIYQDRLNASQIDMTVAEINLPAVFDRLFANLLNDPVPITDKPQVILIDALDEATRNGKNELAELIRSEFNRLPTWLRFIVTTRPHEQEINFSLQALAPWKLEAQSPENVEDIRAYLRRELRSSTGDGTPSEKTVTEIVEKSESLFLYVIWVREELQQGRLSLEHLEQFPQGLGGIYADFFQRYFPDTRQYASDCRPALEAICAVREPLARRELASLLGSSEYEMRSLTARLGSLFPESNGKVRFFHQSVRDWLTDARRSGPYYVDVGAQENRLADLAWHEYKNGVQTMGHYCLMHGPAHLAACQRKIELGEVLLDFAWIEAKLQAAGLAGLLADYDLTLDLFSTTSRDTEEERLASVPTGIPSVIEKDRRYKNALNTLRATLRLSAHVLNRHPEQLRGQITGRLRGSTNSEIQALLRQAAAVAASPWLSPVTEVLAGPGGPQVRTLVGHTDGVTCAAVLDDVRVVSGSRDGTLRVWNVHTARELAKVQGHSGWITELAALGGRVIFAASNPNCLRLFEVDDSLRITTIHGHGSRIVDVAALDDRHVVVAYDDRRLQIWDVNAREIMHTMTATHHGFTSVAALGVDRIVSSSYDGMLHVWDRWTGALLDTFTSTRGLSHVAVLNPRRLLALRVDGVGEIWDTETRRQAADFESLVSHGQNAIAAVDEHRIVVAASKTPDHHLWFMDIEHGKIIGSLEGHSSWTNVLRPLPSGHLLSGSDDHTLRVWDLEAVHGVPQSEGHGGLVRGVAIAGRYAASASSVDGAVRVWDVTSGKLLRVLRCHDDELLCDVAISKEGLVAAAAYGHSFSVWDLESGTSVCHVSPRISGLKAIATLKDQEVISTCSDPSKLRIWNLKKGALVRTLDCGLELGDIVVPTSDLCVCAVTAIGHSSIEVWDLRIGKQIHTLQGHRSKVTALAVLDGQHIVSGSEDNTLRLWDLASGTCLRVLSGHDDSIAALATLSPILVASCAADKTIRLWNIATGEVIARFDLDNVPTALAADPLRKILVMGDFSGKFNLFRLVHPNPQNAGTHTQDRARTKRAR